MSDDHQKREGGRVSILSDLYIDLLGSLLPGLFTVILIAAVALPSAGLALRTLGSANDLGGASTSPFGINGTPDVWIGPYGTTAVALVISYIVGSVLYRQDPKHPDWRSARRVWIRSSDADRRRLAVQPKNDEAGDITAEDAQFPYRFLYEYLDGRGLNHLAALIPWRGRAGPVPKQRTKMFINMLKIRLQFLIPDRCKEIVRNEAHVRLATSVWYATRWVMFAVCALLALVGLTLSIATFALGAAIRYDLLFSGALGCGLTVFLFSWFIQRRIERFIHYLRVREIVYVLETAHFANQMGYDVFRDGDTGDEQIDAPAAAADARPGIVPSQKG